MPIMDDDEQPKPKADIVVGADLSTLSEHELEERISRLKAEVERIKEVLGAKRASRDAAASFFKS